MTFVILTPTGVFECAFSYPSSPNADRLKKPNGVWTLRQDNEEIFHADTAEEVHKHFQSIVQEYRFGVYGLNNRTLGFFETKKSAQKFRDHFETAIIYDRKEKTGTRLAPPILI